MSPSDYFFDPNLATAATLPSKMYFDPAWLDLEKQNVFSKTWQLIGRMTQVERPGDFFTVALADEPLLIIRGRDGTLRAMSNVCRHRAGPIATGEGNRPVLQCGYHGWTYSTEGRLLKTPEFSGVQNFDSASVCLPQFQIDSWAGLLFVNLDSSAPPLQHFFGSLVADIAHLDLTRRRFAARKIWELDCNWKVYVDNYLEGYHIPIVHPSLYRELDYANYRTETRRYDSIQHSPIRASAERLRRADDDDEARFYWIFPNLMLNVYADNFSTNVILPLGPERTVTIFDWYFEDPADSHLDSTMAFSDEIQIEDMGICEAVQRGLRSRTYDSGRFSVARENGVHHFHGLLAEFLNLPQLPTT
ncbi:MAG TPA: SRPBCC family protein [Thermoanaerobaculia bacterium]|nr:SRPBCC family protein [Thermoanaerobaculia bacterium]